MAAKSEGPQPQHVLCESATKHDLKGVNPAISIAAKEGPVVMVYQHWKPGLHGIANGIYYCQGTLKDKKITWGTEQTLETEGCSFPKVSITNDGTAVLVYGKGTRCYYRTGQMQKNVFTWDPEQMIDEGAHPSVSVSDDKPHVVVVSFITNNHGYVRVGAVDQSAKKIVWKDDKHEVTADKLEDLTVAINQKMEAVVAYRTGMMVSTVHCKTGKVEGGQVVFTGEEAAKVKEVKGYYPSVSINKHGCILLIFEHMTPMRKIMAHCGVIKKGEVQWKGDTADNVDSGHKPSVSLTSSGEFVEVHESHLPVVDQSMFYRIGELQ